MLEVVNLSKIYKSKKGAEVRALDGVSLQFPETGMVFLLGKSGSGKSTLLNVCGGLDSPSGGEIIVKGRSSKNFSQSDFDSYRNTFIGFIFQEYNILNEFSVEDNIALALELQGKSKDRAAINSLLEQVDLLGMAKRKPNTLSGGQKQRIAIARALIKSPEIIMADEPTGALDSNTGRQVLETLKKLSRDKLVIVVSHDREFAETYGDRIIELKDGKVLSDVSKTQLDQKALTENVNSVGEILCVKSGSKLSDADFEKIKAFLKETKEDVIIAGNGKDVANFKKIARINDDGKKEVFCQTDPENQEKKVYTKADSRFIRSKLPARHAMKIGLSSLKTKPFRLFLTVLLCTVAFVMFGLLSTLNFYDSERTFRETLAMSQLELLQVNKYYEVENTWYINGEPSHKYSYANQTCFSQADFDELRSSFGESVFGGVPVSISLNIRSTPTNYWRNEIGTVAYLGENHALREKIRGAYPVAEDEIVLSSYTVQMLFECKTYDGEGKNLELNSAEDLVGKTILIGGEKYKVVGIFDCGMPPEKYDSLKESTQTNDRLIYDYQSALRDGLYLVAFVSKDRLELLADQYRPYKEDMSYYRQVVSDLSVIGEYEFPEYGNASYFSVSSAYGEFTPVIPGKTNQPGDDEVIVSSGLFYRELLDVYYRKAENVEDDRTREELYRFTENINSLLTGVRYEYSEEDKETVEIKLTKEELAQYKKDVSDRIAKDQIELKLGLKLFEGNSQVAYGEVKEYTVIGVFEGAEYDNYLYFSDAVVDTLWEEHKVLIPEYSMTTTNYQESSDAVYGVIYLPFDGTEEQATVYWDLYRNRDFKDDDSRMDLTGSFVEDLRFADEMIRSLSMLFMYVGLVFAVFAILLFSNFISVSISQKKREIGILRAVGARSFDVFKIFFSESFFIAFLCILLSIVGTVAICYVINLELAATLGASLLVFGLPSLLVLIGVALATAILSTFLPVYKAARKKPVDSIRSI